jgi:PAS domain S-box-containing protein
MVRNALSVNLSRLALYVSFSGWVILFIYVLTFLEYEGYNFRFMEHFLSVEQNAIKFRALILFAPFISMVLGYLVYERSKILCSINILEEKYRDLYENAPDGYFSFCHDGTIVGANRVFFNLLGLRGGDVVGRRKVFELVAEEDRLRCEEACTEVKETGHVENAEFELIRGDGGRVPVLMNARVVHGAGGVEEIRAIARDNTVRRWAEDALRHRLEIERLVAAISTDFLNISPKAVDEGINNALKAVGEFMGVDRSYVFAISGNRMENTHEWRAGGIGPGRCPLRGMPTEAFPWWMEKLGRFEQIHIPRVKDLPAEAVAERETLQAMEIESLMAVPMVYGKSLVGFLGLDSVREGKSWAEEDLALLKVIGEVFVNALERKRAGERIRSQIEHLRALRNIDMTITASLDLRVTMNVLVDEVVSQLRADGAAVLLLNPYTLRLEYASSKGFRTEAMKGAGIKLGEGLAGRAALERRPLSIPDIREGGGDFAASGLLEAEGVRSYFGVPLVTKGQVKGVLEIFHRSPREPDAEWLEFLYSLAGQAAIAMDNASMLQDLQHSRDELIMAYDTTIEGWSRALDYRDKETEGHSQRVTEMTMKIARHMGMREQELVHVRRGALLHDIGKLGVPDCILLKPDKLNEEEWVIMKRHPEIAYELLSPIPYLKQALDIPYCHHEKWDGTGYPRGLKAEQIPLAARIFAVVDVWDAMNSERPYRHAYPKRDAREHIRSLSGTHFDPMVAEVFLSINWEGRLPN